MDRLNELDYDSLSSEELRVERYSNTDSIIAAVFSYNLKLEELNLSNLCLDSQHIMIMTIAMNNITNLRKLYIVDTDN